MPDFPREDPRDVATEATLALRGIVDLLSMCDEPVDRSGMEHVLRIIHNRLEPATQALHDFVPRI